MKILIIDEKKTRREELASINKEVNNILKNVTILFSALT